MNFCDCCLSLPVLNSAYSESAEVFQLFVILACSLGCVWPTCSVWGKSWCVFSHVSSPVHQDHLLERISFPAEWLTFVGRSGSGLCESPCAGLSLHCVSVYTYFTDSTKLPKGGWQCAFSMHRVWVSVTAPSLKVSVHTSALRPVPRYPGSCSCHGSPALRLRESEHRRALCIMPVLHVFD